MPIPIPIPVPAGPPQGGGKFAHQQRHQHQHPADEDEGEVKKIYLLQPVQKLQPQPQLKGGGFMGGPVQTHIHMPAPQVVAQHQRQHYRSTKQHNYEPEERPQFTAHNKHQQQSELKILPIVVIPPIAPMPPIQLPPTNQAQAPRMTLTPQFNNYVVAASDRGFKKPHRNGQGGHSSLQDYKSFSDYNFVASGSNYRDQQQQQQRMRPRMRGRQRERLGRGQSDNGYSASRLARIRQLIDEESMDDFDHNIRYAGQSSRVVPRYAPGAGGSRRRQQLEPDLGASQLRADILQSNRDQVVDQQSALFDDEPSNMAEPGRDSQSVGRDQHRASARRLRQFMDGSETMNSPANSIPDHFGRDYDDGRSTSGSNELHDDGRGRMSQQLDHSAQDSTATPSDYQRTNHRGDLSSVYYERDGADYQNNDAAIARDRRSQYAGGEREVFENDEWRFDTIKSVAHLDPQAKHNATNLPSVDGVKTSNSDPSIQTTTTIPPAINATQPLVD